MIITFSNMITHGNSKEKKMKDEKFYTKKKNVRKGISLRGWKKFIYKQNVPLA